MSSWIRKKRGQVRLWCANRHDHWMGLEQGERLLREHDPCCWCHAPYVQVDHGPMCERRLHLPPASIEISALTSGSGVASQVRHDQVIVSVIEWAEGPQDAILSYEEI